jgi:lipopolysaccharide transport system ATP-binding protein
MKPIIRVENLSKQYRLGGEQKAYTTFRETLAEAAKKPFEMLRRGHSQTAKTFWALQNINFEVMPGEVVGIIGRNGAGKSTLLKILSRITEPTSGKIELFGRVASLLEVGTGFHAELTGRENIFLNGAILGMRREEIAKKFDEIVAFAEIEKFLDTPVKHYSSGMYVRLAFAVAAHLEPEILIVDEVLAVGDAEFQKKCLGKMDEVSKTGRTILFVSHQMGMLAQLCESCILLEKGNLKEQGKTENIVDTYLNQRRNGSSYHYDENQVTGKNAYFIYQKMVDDYGNEIAEITNETSIILESKIRVENFHAGIEIAFSLQNRIKGRIFTINVPLGQVIENNEREKIIRLEIPSGIIVPNLYSWISAIHIPGSQSIDVLADECDFFIRDVGSEFARYEGVDYGCVKLSQYKIHTFDE